MSYRRAGRAIKLSDQIRVDQEQINRWAEPSRGSGSRSQQRRNKNTADDKGSFQQEKDGLFNGVRTTVA